MKYLKQELIWIRDLLDKAVLEVEEQMEACKDYPQLKSLAELRRDNMQDLRDKVNADITRMIAKGKPAR